MEACKCDSNLSGTDECVAFGYVIDELKQDAADCSSESDPWYPSLCYNSVEIEDEENAN